MSANDSSRDDGDDRGLQERRISRHSQQPLVSEHRVRLTGTPIILRGSHGPTLLKVHGALMLLAWMLTGSVGTFMASFYKNDWTSRTLCGQKVWFQVHRGLMVLTVALTVVGFGLPFVYRRGWSMRAGVHPVLGCCVLALSLLQPITACARPAPDSPRRSVFTWLHWGVGSLTEGVAVAAMFLGVGQSSLPLPSSLATHILIGYVSWMMAFRLLLLIHKHFYMTKFRADDQRTLLSDQSDDSIKSSWFRFLVLSTLVLGNLGLLSALLSCVCQL
ncbi:ferric-chelate reductase 1-like [Eucyclogobius newberryi]|uniref:ferric-chelate reductase 1-like n=1 Tax=Eucyclogobius newberryi TaxID=166745 RepID=UPI003B5B66C8